MASQQVEKGIIACQASMALSRAFSVANKWNPGCKRPCHNSMMLKVATILRLWIALYHVTLLVYMYSSTTVQCALLVICRIQAEWHGQIKGQQSNHGRLWDANFDYVMWILTCSCEEEEKYWHVLFMLELFRVSGWLLSSVLPRRRRS